LRLPKTDYGTVILHWVLVAGFAVAFFTGLRIATEAPDRQWINLFDRVLPSGTVWTTHMQAAIGLVAVSLAYGIYIGRSGLGRRIQLDGIVLRGLVGQRRTKLGSVSIILNWMFFAAMLTLIISGAMLYFGIYAGHAAATLHWYATWISVAFAGLHLFTHYRIGGASQLLRIFRPTSLREPSPKLDAVELLTLLVEQSARLAPELEQAGRTLPSESAPFARQHEIPRSSDDPGTQSNIRPDHRHEPVARPRVRVVAAPDVAAKPRNPTFDANPFAVALAVAITGASFVVAADRLSVDRLEIHRIGVAEAPAVDGDTSDRAWRNIEPFSVMTSEGGNFDGKGETRIDIRAVHDGTWAYFLFTWDDPTRSMKQLPLIKQADGWHVLHNGYEVGDEHEYNEDKFSVLLTTSDTTLAGDHTFHAGRHPVAEAPPDMTGRGLHFTAANAGIVDVWEWKATCGGPTGWMEDAHFGPPLPPTPMQVSNSVPYHGGFAPDPGTANYLQNFVDPQGDLSGSVTPRRLPLNLTATSKAMGDIDLDPDHGESDGARWFMTEDESIPYTAEADSRMPMGAVIPGVIIAGAFQGDRADVRAVARWASGHWALEVVRRLDTGSPYDVALKTGVFMRVAAFDHSQIRHTRHTRPIRIEVE
jgi:hypothetical protein